MKYKLQTKSCHDANFVVNGRSAGCRNDNLRCVSDDKVGIMTTLPF